MDILERTKLFAVRIIRLSELFEEANELTAILVTSVKTLKARTKK